MISDTLKTLIIDTLENAKAKDIIALDVHPITNITDYMFFCTGTSSRHVKSIGDHLTRAAKDHRIKILGVEGEETGDWVLVDLGDAVIHIMQAETREFYQLEKLWGFEPELKNTQRG